MSVRVLVRYLADQLLRAIQRRCEHPPHMVAADLLEGCVDGLQIHYCNRCGAVKTDWNPMHRGKPSRFAAVPHWWRTPDPNLWRGR